MGGQGKGGRPGGQLGLRAVMSGLHLVSYVQQVERNKHTQCACLVELCYAAQQC